MTKEQPSFRDYAALRHLGDGYEPPQLWLIPVLLRARDKYYEDAVAQAEKDIERSWADSGRYYGTREKFEKSSLVNHIWSRSAPLWWGLNDIVGFIDVRAAIREQRIDASLFLTIKRPSRRLIDKSFVCRRQEHLDLAESKTNRQLRSGVVRLVESLAHDKRLRKRHVPLESWRRLVRYTDIAGILRDAVENDKQ